MPQSLANVQVHVIFSTKHRTPRLTPELRAELFPYLMGILRNCGCAPLQVGGVEDHVHLLFQLSRTASLAYVVEQLKSGSNRWIRNRGDRDFAWQSGYGALSVGPLETDRIARYIAGQEAHHGASSFQDELREILREAGVAWDERYLWD